MIERVLVSPDTVTVLGYRVKPTDAAWTGLELDKAEQRTQSTLMVALVGTKEAPEDIHLNVPWCHPEDRAAGHETDCMYRVRPRMKPGRKWQGKMVRSVAFERCDDKWFLATEYKAKRAP